MSTNMKTPLPEIRGLARETILLNTAGPVALTLLLFLIRINLGSVSLLFTASESIGMVWVGEGLSIAINVFLGILLTGRAKYFTALCEHKPASVKMLFSAFRENPGRILACALMLRAIEFVCTLPSFVYTIYFPIKFEASKETFLAYALLFGGYIIFLLCTLAFMPLYYILAEFSNMPASKAIRMSIWLMKGNKTRYLNLMISLIPLWILGYVSLGIGFIWISPIIQSCYAHFYLDLLKQKQGQPQ